MTTAFACRSSSPPDGELDAVFAALADPTRRAIVAQLAGGERSVNELALPRRMSGPAVTKHLKVLQKAGLISRGKRAQQRPCRLEPEPLKEATDWMEQYRRMWEARLDRLEDYLAELQGKPKKNEK
ncbi:MAG TPA: metalloregulator ArsR/SmtB family transcription factor [Fibrobacteria bacterium]|nr:metalloregulator ArsR/SmtB family transcription factor [Fibrobacteria bacterium]